MTGIASQEDTNSLDSKWDGGKKFYKILTLLLSDEYEGIDPIPHQLLRKYIGYARQYVSPRLSTEATQILQGFYLELRKQSQRLNSSPITTRQLESLIRLTEVR